MTTTELESPVTLPAARSLTRQRLLIAAGLAIALIVRAPCRQRVLAELDRHPDDRDGLAGIGLNLLMGYTGLVSLGSGAFMAIGAFATYNLLLRLPFIPLPFVLLLSGLIAAVFGVFFGLPSLRIRGFYLAASTLGAQFFFQWLFTNFNWFSNDTLTLTISAPRLEFLAGT